MVVVKQWFGQASRYHPDLHCMVAEGAWDKARRFTPLFVRDAAKIRQLFEVEVFRFLRKEALLSQERMGLIKSWKHSGFNVNLERTLHPSDHDETKQLGRHLLRAPVAENRLDYDRANQIVTVDLPDGDSVAMDAWPPQPWRRRVLDSIARLVVQIPDRHEKTTVYYGLYSNAHKLRENPGKDPNEAEQASEGEAEPQHDFKSKKKTRLRWAQLMETIWKACPAVALAEGGQTRCCAPSAALG